ncbi:NmrA family NAD(P)-binding protein [Mycobacterium hackensackense]|uniref:NmrA family NAD(P)-binding protein n=1 Tax=Mycobacterium hackensackense TaxID=228909 RepID=UPI002265D450|nr:NmrA family NAD(P)-binding protein [Mycobacterium hackensackense]MCV7256265.1 NmrA family NAD(P)-binding protein [Mycobacterium hackensackense]
MSSDSLFLITGATGNTAAPTVKILREAGHRVRAFVHVIDQRSEALAEIGAEVVQGDLLDFHALSAAMAGVDAAYFCYPILTDGLLAGTVVFAQAASEAGVGAVVNMSQISARRDAKSHAAQQHWLSERLLDRSSFLTTHLRPTFFAEWLTWAWRRDDTEAVLRLPFGTGRHAPIAAHDQANVIAAILQNPTPHDRQIYPLVGAKELDHYAIADEIAATLGITVQYEPLDIPAFARLLADKGYDRFGIAEI